MACASASELNRRVATGLANASLLPELQNLRTSMHPFEYLLRLGSNGLLFSGSGEPAKRSFSRMILLRAEAESSACFRSHAENETTYSDRSAEPQPTKFPRDRKSTRLNSSHTVISYAVFCLKKKKKKKNNKQCHTTHTNTHT